MPLPRQPALWFSAFAIWCGTLWWLSSGVREFPDGLDFRTSDKLLHFGYFFGGAGLFSAAVLCLKPELKPAARVILTVVVVGLIGLLDEFHQSFVPGRSGNDPADLLADVLGALAGSLVFQRFRGLLE